MADINKENAVLIVAGGSGARAGGDLPKQYRLLGGKPLLRHTVSAFLASSIVGKVRVVIGSSHENDYRSALSGLTVSADKLLEPVTGGAERQESVRLGLESLVGLKPDNVFIHDAARPFVSQSLLVGLMTAIEDGQDGAITAIRVVDTLKRSGPGDTAILGTVNRADLWQAQTPQLFRFQSILNAHRAVADGAFTDDAAIAEAAGLKVRLVEGERKNLKITTEEDFRIAENYLATGPARLLSRRYVAGSGFDVHRFGPGDAIVLCGVKIAHERGLAGHSDADVALHALTDALLGAIGGGDIGVHFPPSDDRWRGAASSVFVAKALELVAEKSGRLENVDLTIICERPKIGPCREDMITSLAQILSLDRTQINVKATTTEGLGYTGRSEGIAAQAIVSVSLPEEQ